MSAGRSDNALRSGGPSRRPAWAELKAELAAAGFRPSKRFGQNFLVDDAMVRAIARDARVGSGDAVVEVGAGLGFLTLALAALGARVTAIEIDPRLERIARRVVGERDHVRWIVADALASKHALSAELERAIPREEPWHLVANLPYSIAAPVVLSCARHEAPPASMTVLVQREMAERFAAAAGDVARGALSVRLQARYSVEIGRAVSRELFAPRPKVESAVVRCELRPDRLGQRDLARIDALATAWFAHRRKTLRSVLAKLLGGPSPAADLCREAGVDPLARAEDLPIEALARLAASSAWKARFG
jgi:16S rRNA (adenine1518-N6/adenine1519-N6)-dimethyltransferase